MAAQNSQYPMNEFDSLLFPDGVNEELDVSLFNHLDDFDASKLASLGVQPNGPLQFDFDAFSGLNSAEASQFMYGYSVDPLYAPNQSIDLSKATHVTTNVGTESIASTSPSLHDSLQPFDLSPSADTPSSTSEKENQSREDHLLGDYDPNLDDQDLDQDVSVYGDDDKDRLGPKKPGRKPLTSEPTTKRKAQNRAAQRAFRERKEKHLKDLEVKVDALRKSSSATSQENNRLRAQVDRLQVELREYRKRLSLSSSIVPINNGSAGILRLDALGGDPQAKVSMPLDKVSTLGSRKLPAANKLLLDRLAKSTEMSLVNSLSSGSPASDRRMSSSSSIEATPKQVVHAAENPARVFRFNSQSSPMPSFTSPRMTDSPLFAHAQSPKMMTPPQNRAGPSFHPPGTTCPGGPHTGDGELNFCELLNMACGNRKNPIPKVMARSRPGSVSSPDGAGKLGGSVTSERLEESASPLGGSPNAWAAFQPEGIGAFTSVPDTITATEILFGDNLFSTSRLGGQINGGVLPAAVVPDAGLGISSVPGLEANSDDDEVVPGEDTSGLMNCHTIWNKLKQRNVETQSIDMDGLCSELRAKARCSENGVVVDQRDVDEALQRLPKKD